MPPSINPDTRGDRAVPAVDAVAAPETVAE
jgi:hypothetical protein